MFKGTFQRKSGFICLNSIQLLDTAPPEPPGFYSLEESTRSDGQPLAPGSACDCHQDCPDGSDEGPATCCEWIPLLCRTLCWTVWWNLNSSVQQINRKNYFKFIWLLSPRIFNDVPVRKNVCSIFFFPLLCVSLFGLSVMFYIELVICLIIWWNAIFTIFLLKCIPYISLL